MEYLKKGFQNLLNELSINHCNGVLPSLPNSEHAYKEGGYFQNCHLKCVYDQGGFVKAVVEEITVEQYRQIS